MQQVQGGKKPKEIPTCVPTGNNPPKPIGGPYPVPLSTGGDNYHGGKFTTFKRQELYKDIYVKYTDWKNDDPTKSPTKRTYEMWIEYKSKDASDSKYYFKLLPHRDHPGEQLAPVETFYLSYDDKCQKVYDNYNTQYIESVEMYEYA